MPIHDWTRVPAGMFHDFHSSWITHIKEALNDGVLPRGYYALAEQHASRKIADVLTLKMDRDEPSIAAGGESGPIAVATAPPKTSRKLVASPEAAFRAARRTVTIRHVSDHYVVALLEIVSSANKDRETSVEEFIQKAWSAIEGGVHLLVIDLFPPGRHDAGGMHNMVWQRYDPNDYEPPPDKPLTAASYSSCDLPEAYVEPLAVGDVLPAMPLFLRSQWYVNTPLEVTYETAYRGVPEYWREVVEGKRDA
jgi:hypothetical protein